MAFLAIFCFFFYNKNMDLDKVYVVLCRPEESRNVGAACRAMANNDISHLRIVGKREDFDAERVRILAIHAADIWEKAEFFDSIQEATADCIISAATTRRRGKKRKGKLFLPEEFCSFVKDSDGKIAVVFGNERTGLTDEEVEACATAVTIPSSENFMSLNLSHAVQIICYHFFRAQDPNLKGYTKIDLTRLDKTVNCIADNLQKIGFFKIAGRSDMENFWRGILSRASLSESEAKYIEKTFTKTAGLASRNSKEDKDPKN